MRLITHPFWREQHSQHSVSPHHSKRILSEASIRTTGVSGHTTKFQLSVGSVESEEFKVQLRAAIIPATFEDNT